MQNLTNMYELFFFGKFMKCDFTYTYMVSSRKIPFARFFNSPFIFKYNLCYVLKSKVDFLNLNLYF